MKILNSRVSIKQNCNSFWLISTLFFHFNNPISCCHLHSVCLHTFSSYGVTIRVFRIHQKRKKKFLNSIIAIFFHKIYAINYHLDIKWILSRKLFLRWQSITELSVEFNLIGRIKIYFDLTEKKTCDSLTKNILTEKEYHEKVLKSRKSVRENNGIGIRLRWEVSNRNCFSRSVNPSPHFFFILSPRKFISTTASNILRSDFV